MTRIVRAAAVQIAPDLDSETGTLARVLETIRDALKRLGAGWRYFLW